MMSVLPLLTVLFNSFLIASSEPCKTNNDCESGRCEWHRCVAKMGKRISGKKEVIACYVDDDCNTREGELCKDGFCVPRKPLMTRVRTNYQCVADEDCRRGHRCGFYKKCYDMSSGRYVSQSLLHIPCDDKAADFCPKITGISDSACHVVEKRMEKKTVRSFVCAPPNFDGNYDLLRRCGGGRGSCPHYQSCLAGTCYNPFWVTVGERCNWDSDCTFMAKCKRATGQCAFNEWVINSDNHCRTHERCNAAGVPSYKMIFRCRNFHCVFRRSRILECSACKFDEYCDLRQNCIRVQRYTDFDCNGDNWFYWQGSFYCSVRTEITFDEAKSDCKRRNAQLVYSPDRGSIDNFDPEKALLSYLAIRDGWVLENTKEVETKFVNWGNHREQSKKSGYFCKKSVSRAYIPNNATAWEQRCQTTFYFRSGNCYHGGFTNFMPRFAIRTICKLLDSEIVRIKNKEEARIVYGIAGGKSFWLGLKREKRDWYWDGGFFGYRARFFFWRTGQPYPPSKHCVFSPNAGEWMSADCDSFISPRAYVCQRPPYKV